MKKELKEIITESVIVVIVFTIIDAITHSLNEEYAVPSYYFRNKMIFGTILTIIALHITRKLKPFLKAITTAGIVSVLLQTRYYLEGYPLDFVITFLFIHFAILLVTIIVFEKLMKKYWKK